MLALFLVILELGGAMESYTADVTFEQLKIQMPTLMILFVTICSVSFAAKSAGKWLLASMQEQVILVAGTIFEAFATFWMGTHFHIWSLGSFRRPRL